MQGTHSVQKPSIQKASLQKIVVSVIASGVLIFSASTFAAPEKPNAKGAPDVQKPAQVQTAAVASVININKADVQTLAQLNGVGEKKAQAIIAYRESRGGFKSVDELLSVKGIGEKLLEKNRAMLSVN